jgi:hypothetical protein
MNLEAVILYSGNDSRFAEACIKSLLELDIKTHVVTYSHMWNGVPESKEKLQEPLNQFIDNSLFYQYVIDWEEGQSPWYWEGLGRYLGTQEVSENSEYILYIDIDEIIDPEKFKVWINTNEYKKYDALRLSTYWYWREPIYRANQLEDNVVMIKTSIAKQLPFTPGGRDIYFNSTPNSIRNVNSNDSMVHHYSWVRTKEEMLNKVSNWGHAGDRVDWKSLVEEEYSRPFNGNDFLHNYQYQIVDNKFNIK